MTDIKRYVEDIDGELESAKAYAEKYLDLKSMNDSSNATRYREMALDELKHAGYIHDYAVSVIDRLKEVYTPPADMEDEWTRAHKKYYEQTAWIKQMLAM
jgi:hypothetical protein